MAKASASGLGKCRGFQVRVLAGSSAFFLLVWSAHHAAVEMNFFPLNFFGGDLAARNLAVVFCSLSQSVSSLYSCSCCCCLLQLLPLSLPATVALVVSFDFAIVVSEQRRSGVYVARAVYRPSVVGKQFLAVCFCYTIECHLHYSPSWLEHNGFISQVITINTWD